MPIETNLITGKASNGAEGFAATANSLNGFSDGFGGIGIGVGFGIFVFPLEGFGQRRRRVVID